MYLYFTYLVNIGNILHLPTIWSKTEFLLFISVKKNALCENFMNICTFTVDEKTEFKS